MSKDLSPESIKRYLLKGQMAPFYLFYGPNEFHLENTLEEIRAIYIPEEVKDFNIHIFYASKGGLGDGARPADILDSARSLPFMTENRLVIVRRVEQFSSQDLESFLPYLDDPVPSTCLIFISSGPDFRMKFYNRLRGLGRAVHFRALNDGEALKWTIQSAEDMGMNMEEDACQYLQQIVGNQLRDLSSELEKLRLLYGNKMIGVSEVEKTVVHSRMHTIFEVMDHISSRHSAESLSVLNRFLQEEGRDASLKILGMLNRQIRLLWRAKWAVERRGPKADLAAELGVHRFVAKKLKQQIENWSAEHLEDALHLLAGADRRIKSGSQESVILEDLVVSLCK